MKYFFGLVGLILMTSVATAQTIHVKFRITPSKGIITIDGEEYKGSRSEYIAMGFNARKGIDEHIVVISSEGYASQTLTFNRDSQRTQTINISLDRSIPKFNTKSNPVIEFEKVISGLDYNTPLGADYRWKYDMKEEINLGDRTDKLITDLANAGLGAEAAEVDDLFGKSTPTKKTTTDILVGGKVTDFKLTKTQEAGFFSYSTPEYTATASINWQFYDKHSEQVIYKATHTNEYSFTSSSSATTLTEFFNSITENLYELVSTDNEFREIIENYERNVGVPNATNNITSESGSTNVQKSYTTVTVIPKVVLPTFEGFEDLVQVATKASVTIITDEKSHGSGFVLSKNGYIITNHHVIDSSESIQVKFSNGMVLDGQVRSSSKKYDLALIKVNVDGLTSLPISLASTDASIGQEVFVVGSPGDQDLGQSVTKGIISGKRNIDEVKTFQTDTKVSPGNSGSPLIDLNGNVIGVVNMKVIGHGIEGISFAVDSKYIFSVLGVTYE
jgi:S1-C subfamily serine protease